MQHKGLRWGITVQFVLPRVTKLLITKLGIAELFIIK